MTHSAFSVSCVLLGCANCFLRIKRTIEKRLQYSFYSSLITSTKFIQPTTSLFILFSTSSVSYNFCISNVTKLHLARSTEWQICSYNTILPDTCALSSLPSVGKLISDGDQNLLRVQEVQCDHNYFSETKSQSIAALYLNVFNK